MIPETFFQPRDYELLRSLGIAVNVRCMRHPNIELPASRQPGLRHTRGSKRGRLKMIHHYGCRLCQRAWRHRRRSWKRGYQFELGFSMPQSNPDELRLTLEDRRFLNAVGVSPEGEPLQCTIRELGQMLTDSFLRLSPAERARLRKVWYERHG